MRSKYGHRVDNIKRGLEIGRRHPFASNLMQGGKLVCNDEGSRRQNSFVSCVGKIVAGFLDLNHRSPMEVSR